MRPFSLLVIFLASVSFESASTGPQTTTVRGFHGTPWGATQKEVREQFPDANWTDADSTFLSGTLDLPFFSYPEVKFGFPKDMGLQAVMLNGEAKAESVFHSLQGEFGQEHKGEKDGTSVWAFEDGSGLSYRVQDSGAKVELYYYSSDTLLLNEPPRAIWRVTPDIPKGAALAGRVVEVKIEVTTDWKGSVVGTRVFYSSGFALVDSAAAHAAQDWLFEPAKQRGIPVPSKIVIPFSFKYPKARRE